MFPFRIVSLVTLELRNCIPPIYLQGEKGKVLTRKSLAEELESENRRDDSAISKPSLLPSFEKHSRTSSAN